MIVNCDICGTPTELKLRFPFRHWPVSKYLIMSWRCQNVACDKSHSEQGPTEGMRISLGNLLEDTSEDIKVVHVQEGNIQLTRHQPTPTK